MQNDFEKTVAHFTATINTLYLNETKLLKQKIEEQDTEIRKLQLTCSNYATTVQQMKESISTLQNSNDDLKKQLQDKEELLDSLNRSYATVDFESEVSLEEMSFETCEEETTYNKRISSLSYSFSTSSNPPTSRKRSYTESEVTSMYHCVQWYLIVGIALKINGFWNFLHF